VRQSGATLTRQSAIDWDNFDLGSSLTASQPPKPAHSTTDRCLSRQEKVDFASDLALRNSGTSEHAVRRQPHVDSSGSAAGSNVPKINSLFTSDVEKRADNDGDFP